MLDAKASIRRILVSLVMLFTVPGIHNKGRRAYLFLVRRASCLSNHDTNDYIVDYRVPHCNENIDKDVAHAFMLCYFQISLRKCRKLRMYDAQRKPRA